MRITVVRQANTEARIGLIAVLVDKPPQAARTRRHAEHQLCGDERAPGEGPADLEAGENRRKRGGDQELSHVAHATQAVILAGHALRLGDSEEPGVGVERHCPQDGVDNDEDEARDAESEPQQASGSNAMRRGSRLNMAVSVDRRWVPMRVDTARVVKTAASAMPAAYPMSSTWIVVSVRSISGPRTVASQSAAAISLKAGNISGLLSQRA